MRDRTMQCCTPVLLAALVAVAVAGSALAAQDPSAAAGPERFEGRGVYYFAGAVQSPVAGMGTRAANATNRIALDDGHSRVSVDRDAHRIRIHNTHRYGLGELVGCLLLMGRGTTASGREVPVAVHLKIHKTLNRFRTSLHPHPTVREKIVSAVFEPFDVVVSNGERDKVVLTAERTVEAVRDPELTARLANIFMQVTDHLEGSEISAQQPGTALVDLSIGLGSTKLNVDLARIRLLSTGADNAELIRGGSVAAMLERGEWEFRVESLAPYVPRSEFYRDFFLFGIEDLPSLQKIDRRGLLRGETLVVGFRDGRGYIGVNEARSEIPDPADVARAYLEFHFVGGVVAQQLSELPGRLR